MEQVHVVMHFYLVHYFMTALLYLSVKLAFKKFPSIERVHVLHLKMVMHHFDDLIICHALQC